MLIQCRSITTLLFQTKLLAQATQHFKLIKFNLFVSTLQNMEGASS